MIPQCGVNRQVTLCGVGCYDMTLRWSINVNPLTRFKK